MFLEITQLSGDNLVRIRQDYFKLISYTYLKIIY
jgi:hypothetical protein